MDNGSAIAIEKTESQEGKVPTQLPPERRTPGFRLPAQERKRDSATVWQATEGDQDPNQEGASDPNLACYQQTRVENQKKLR